MRSLTASVHSHQATSGKRKLAKVPFVELFDGRMQGVVSSASDPARVYVSFVEGKTGAYSCSTNNNRPCSGGGRMCGHIDELLEAAIFQFGAEHVARYLGCPDGVSSTQDIARQLPCSKAARETGEVFARFLDYLRYVGLPRGTEPLPEMAFFVTP